MDKGYFSSTQFRIAATIAVLILSAGLGAAYLNDRYVGPLLGSGSGCGQPEDPSGSDLTPQVATLRERDARDDLWRVNGTPVAIHACVAVGELLFGPAEGDEVVVHARIRGHDAAVDDARVQAKFVETPGGLVIVAWQARVGEAGSAFGSRSAETVIEILVPEGARPDVTGVVSVGGLRASELMLRNVRLSVDVGDLRLLSADVSDLVTLHVDVGDLIAQFDSVQTGTIRATNDVGDIELALPSRADIGYDVDASSDVGDVSVRIGETENYVEKNDHGPGGSVQARSHGYSSRPTQVRVTASADVGDVDIHT